MSVYRRGDDGGEQYTIRRWCQKFGQQFANELRRRRPRPGDKWHLDEVTSAQKVWGR